MSVEEANFKLLLSIGLDMFGNPTFETKSFEFGGTGMEGEDVDMCINYSISQESMLIYDIYIIRSRDNWVYP